jgi:predicted RNase H-like HicB family nuclease
MRLPVIITRGEDGYFIAEIPIIPGYISQGKTKQEVVENIKEAAELCIEAMQQVGWIFPEEYTLNHIEVDEK